MKVRLDVLASTSVKCKKPWSQIVWLGKEKESLFLLDDKRVSVLYVPSGKTKKHIQKLSGVLSETVCLTPAPGGLYLVGVQASGEVYVWQKDKDELKTIVGLASLLVDGEITPGDGCKAFPSSDCSQLLLVLGNRHVFLWQKESWTDDSKNNTLLGKWSRVTYSNNIQIPSLDCKEVSMHATFTYTEAFGYCCQLSIVFNQQANLNISSLLIRFSPNVISSQLQTPSALTPTWICFSKPLKTIQAGWEPISLRGAYTCQYSHDGQILAVGVNQKSPKQISVLFMSTFTEAMLVSDLKGCGLRDPNSKRGRQYWISDMAWTSDNLFLAVILHNGSAGLLSRLGETVVIFSKGSSVELGPAYFLTFSPLISVQSDKNPEAVGYDQSHPDLDPLHQRFSVSSHPSLPILLFSDGYIVTIAQLPNELSPMMFMRDLVLNSSSHLKQIAEAYCMDLTLANAYNLPAGEHENVKMSAHRIRHNRPQKNGDSHYSFEEPSTSLNETLDSEVSFALGAHESGKVLLGAVQNMSSGKIIFGEDDVLLETERSYMKEPDSTLKSLQLARINLFSVWKLAASTSELWSANMDTILNHAVHNIIKLFSLVLDCPQIKDLLDEASAKLLNSPLIHTTSLYKVVSMYRQLLDLLQFDYQQHHLLAHMLQLSHKTLSTILSSVGLSQCDPRIKTLTGCFTLLKFTEKSMHRAYVSLPKSVQSIALNSTIMLGEDENKFQLKGAESSQLSKRLTATWKLLYKSVTQFIANSEMAAADVRQAQALRSAIEQQLIELDVDIPSAPVANINNGERLSLDGKHTLAVNAWKEQLKQYQEVGSMKNASQLLHSLLYTYILRNDLTAAIAFVDDLIVKANPDIVYGLDSQEKASSRDLKSSVLNVVTSNLRTRAMHDPDMMPCIRNRAIRKVVQSVARFMAAYFGNQTIFIFPPHNPSPLPAVHFEPSSANSRIIPKYHEDVAAIIRHQKLGSIWTVERTMEYLLLSGLVCEAAWFADRMGNWKAAYRLSVAHILHKQLVPSVYERPKRPLSLPEWLTPDAIMKRKLEQLVKDDLKPTKQSSDLTHLMEVLKDISLSGIMGFVEIGPWLLEQLVAKLKSVLKQLSPLVSKDFYLPAPPLYLPQLVRTEQKLNSQEANEEILLREKASSIIQLALCVMNATHLSTAALQWYVRALSEAQKKAAQFKVGLDGPCALPDFLYQYTEPESVIFPHPSDDDSVLSVQASFRDLCSLVWLLHTRDQLSLALRSREKHLNLGLDVDNGEQWLRECFFTLQWAVHMVPFSRFLSDEASIYKVVLSLLLDFPSTEDVANVLAEHMYDLENLHPEVQERLDRLLNSWQGIILTSETNGKSVEEMSNKSKKLGTFLNTSPRGKSLSVYFHRQCMVTEKSLKKKRQCFGSYEEFVFAEVKNELTEARPALNIGSRPFEIKKSYIDFLDTFVSVSFGRISESEGGRKNVASLPLLKVFAPDIVSQEMTHFTQTTADSAHSKHQGLSVFSGASQTLARASSQESVYPPTPKKEERINRPVPGRTSGRNRVNTIREKENHEKPGRPVGLFRGMSMMESPSKRNYTPVRRYESEPFLDDLGSVDESEVQPASQTRRIEHTLTELASRFWRSDENIYQTGGVQEQVNSTWSLTVSFGKKYAALQKVVEWLEVWGSKSHALGISDKEEILEVTPQMKIQIPAQLIVLSLWLLEHKYSRGSEEEQRAEKCIRSKRSRRLNQRHRSQLPSPSKGELNTARAHHSRTHEPSYVSKPKESHQTSVRGHQDQRLTSAEKNRDTNDQVPRLSLPFPTLEQDQIINAYTQLLDGSRDSSSFDLSSLASDELDSDLKTTLNVIRRTEKSGSLKETSVLNQTLLLKDDSLIRQEKILSKPKESSTPVKQDSMHSTTVKPVNSIAVKQGSVNADHRAQDLSLTPSSHLGTQDQTDAKNINQSKGTTLPVELPSQPRNQDLGEGIASQLQGVIRDELRRIMEVQHRDVLAMMGALEGNPPSDSLPDTSQLSSSATQRQPHVSSKKKIVSPKRSKRSTQTQTSSNQFGERRYMEDEMQAPFSVTDAHRRQDGRGDHVRQALVELQNLQYESNQYSHHNRLQQPHYTEDISTRGQNMFQNYLGPQGGNNLNLPFLPRQAWTENSIQQPPPFLGFGFARLPLLHINKPQEPEDSFRNLRRFLSQVPPPQVYIPQPTQLFFPSPQPSSQPQLSFFIPPSQPQRLPPPPYDQPLPLLTASVNERAPSGFPFLRMLSPGFSYMNSDAAADKISQRDKIEENRQKLLRKFHEQVLLDKENAERQKAANQMLHLEISEELESARSDKSRASVKSQADSNVENVYMEGQERAASVQKPVQEQQEVKVADASTSDTHIQHGFVLPRGVFDSYLQLGEQLIGPEVSETSAAFQLRMAQAMQQQVEKRIRARVDFSTMARDLAMEAALTAQAAESVTKDTGVDPIQEIVDEYNLKRHNNLIPPDIFMGLRFGDQDAQNGVEPLAPSSAPGRGRSYLNVVDIRASSILRDIPERTERHETLVDQEKLDTAILMSERTAQQVGALEETLRQKFAPRPDVTSVPGYDAVTVRLFDQLRASKDNLMSVAVMPRSSVTQPKVAMLRRLQDMTDQMKAMDEMSQNIEREFKSSNLLLKTIQEINDSVQRSRSTSPVRTSVHKSKKKELRYYGDEEEESKASRQSSPDVPELKISASSPQASARSRSTAGSRSGERVSKTENELTRLITEVLAQEGADLQAAGFSQEMAEQLEIDAREQIQKSSKMADLKLKDRLINMKQADEHVKSRTPYEREQLKTWMTQKFHQRQEEYMKRRKELIDREPKPFRSQTTVTKHDLKSLEEKSNKRISMVSEFMNQRLIDAEHLLGSIIVDKPDIPWGSVSSVCLKHRNQSRSPGRQGSSVSPPRGGGSRTSRSPGRSKINEATWTYKAASVSRSPYGTDISKMSRETTPVRGILKSSKDLRSSSTDMYLGQQVLTSISEGDRTMDSSTDLINYARQVLEKDNNDKLSPLASFEKFPETRPELPSSIQMEKNYQPTRKIETAKGKSFADMVKMRRPEATRKWNAVNKQRKLQAENEKQAAKQEILAKFATSQNPNLQKDRAKDYGSKHIPGFTPRQTVPRRVKTYSERLQEMKPNRQYSTSARKDLSSARTLSTATFHSSAPVGPRQTYKEQPQNLRTQAMPTQRPIQVMRASKKTPVMMRTYLKSHGPKHKPKTYAEQLQELNPHPRKEVSPKRIMQSTVTVQGSTSRGQARTRPYSDPYSDVDYEELASVLSDWDVDENVRNIIYGGLSPSSSATFMPMNEFDMRMAEGNHHHVPSEDQSDYFDAVMQGVQYRSDARGELGTDDYSSSVDINEIHRLAELASVGSASVLSVIDWDAVENLIKDV